MPALTVLFDGRCSLCRASAERVRRFDPHRRIELVDLHDPSSAVRFPGIDREEAMKATQAVDREGRVFRGAEAWARIGLELPGWKAVAWILLVPGVRWVADKVYAMVARNRYRWNRAACTDGSCSVHLGRRSSRS